MDPVTAAGLGAASGALQSYVNYQAQMETNNANAYMADKQMRFQRDMSNTAHQREVQDLQKAGLNPALSASGGQGASTPQGAAPTLVAPQISLPDLFQYGISMKQMEQADQNLTIQDKLATSKILTDIKDRKLKVSEHDLNLLKQKLLQKDMPKALLGEEVAELLGISLRKFKEKLQNSVKKDKWSQIDDAGTPQQQRQRALENRLP